jgi:hypothetical protein
MTMWDRKQRLFEKSFEAVDKGKDTPSFWAYLSKELAKFPDSEAWAKALLGAAYRHSDIGRCRNEDFGNFISDEEVQHLLDKV